MIFKILIIATNKILISNSNKIIEEDSLIKIKTIILICKYKMKTINQINYNKNNNLVLKIFLIRIIN